MTTAKRTKQFLMSRYVLGIGLWAAVTAVAIAAIWFGVSTATRSVIGTSFPELGKGAITKLAAQPGRTQAASPSVRAAPKPSVSRSVTPTSATALSTTTTTPRSVAGTASSTSTSIAHQQTVTEKSATFTNHGGLINVSCNRARITLDSAVPADGYSLSVLSGGPNRVIVQFIADNDAAPIAAICINGAPKLQPRPAAIAVAPPSSSVPVSSSSTSTSTTTTRPPPPSTAPPPPPSTSPLHPSTT